MENLTFDYFNKNVTDNLPGHLGLNVTKVALGRMEMELEVKKKTSGNQWIFACSDYCCTC